MADAPKFVSREVVENLVDGQRVINLKQVFRVENASSEANALSVMPSLGTTITYIIGLTDLTLRSRVARLEVGVVKPTLYLTTLSYTNDTASFQTEQNFGVPGVDENGEPVDDPTKAAKTLNIRTQKVTEIIDDAQLLRFFQPGSSPPNQLINIPPHMPPITSFGPILNSALVDQQIMRERSLDVISISKVIKIWDPTLKSFRDTINDAPVTITQTDKTGNVYIETYGIATLRFDDVLKDDIWIDGELFFRQTIVLTHDPEDWHYRNIDKGNMEYLFVGQNRFVGEKDEDGVLLPAWDQDAINDNGSQWRAITSYRARFAGGTETLLNGDGTQLYIASANDNGVFELAGPVMYEYSRYPSSDFTLLDL